MKLMTGQAAAGRSIICLLIRYANELLENPAAKRGVSLVDRY